MRNVLGILFVLTVLFVLFFAFQPELTENLADFLYPEDKNTGTETSQTWQDLENNAAGNPGENGILSTVSAREQYVVPEESAITVPENVAGKNGYQPITEDAKEISETEGEKLAETTGYGETGEGLEFDTRFNPYYGMLDSILQSVYRQIYANAVALNPTFAPIEDVSMNQLKNSFTAVFGDHPELFWLDTAYACKYMPSGKCVETSLQFNNTATNLDASRQEFENSANTILQGASGLSSDYDKEVFLHDALLNQAEYNLNAPLNQSAYSALVNGQTVCAGYARAYQYLMQKLGIPCYYCMGFAGENHAWNIVSLDDGYYNVDTTWDDTNPNTYDYFNKSDNDFNQNHMRKDLSVYLPPCNGEKYQNLEQSTSEENTTTESETEENTTTEAAAEEAITEEDASGEIASEEAVISTGRTLADAGFTEDDVKNSLADYYTDCYNQILENGMGEYQFQTVVNGSDLFEQVYESYIDESYKDAYAYQAIADLGANDYIWYIQAEELQGGYYLFSHTVLIQ